MRGWMALIPEMDFLVLMFGVNRVCWHLLYFFMSSAVHHDFASFLFLNKMYALQTFTNDKW